MDIVERAPLETVRTPTLMGCEHRHRYELAASVLEGQRVLDLCCGVGYGSEVLAATAREVVGVDYSVAAVDTARAEFGSDRVSFQVSDAVAFLRGLGGDTFDAIVCFEGLEHLPDPDAAFAELRRLAGEGVKMVLSIPNSKTFGERNQFHVTDFEYDSAIAAFESLGADVRILVQLLAEGSLIVERPGSPVSGGLVYDEDVELDYANHYIAFVNVAPVDEATFARMQFAIAPNNNRYMRSLELANAELAQANAKLARARLGAADSAAAAQLSRIRDQAEQRAMERLGELEGTVQTERDARHHAETLAREAWHREEQLKQRVAELEARTHPVKDALARVLRRR